MSSRSRRLFYEPVNVCCRFSLHSFDWKWTRLKRAFQRHRCVTQQLHFQQWQHCQRRLNKGRNLQLTAASAIMHLQLTGASGIMHLQLTGASGIMHLQLTGASGIMHLLTGPIGIMHLLTGASGIMHLLTGASGIMHLLTGASGIMHFTFSSPCIRLSLKCDGTHAETRFRLPAKRTSQFKSAWASVQSTTGNRVVCWIHHVSR
jgi:hypothetical protein